MSVDTNATTAELDNKVIESVLDGNNELLRDVSSSATNSMKETTVSHLNKSRQNILLMESCTDSTKSGLLVKRIMLCM